MGQKFKVFWSFWGISWDSSRSIMDIALIGPVFLLVAAFVILLVAFVTAPIWLGRQIFIDEGWENASWGKKGWWLFMIFYLIAVVVHEISIGERWEF